MAKMREYKFFKDDADETPIETLDRTSWKTAVKSIQNKIKDKKVIIEYVSKKCLNSRCYDNFGNNSNTEQV